MKYILVNIVTFRSNISISLLIKIFFSLPIVVPKFVPVVFSSRIMFMDYLNKSFRLRVAINTQ